ncbi:MAG TPA: YCF48-related protein, partial [Chthoniobacterales bacterium]|nr:YCF48-related protein [Chthoniobacterales bacterium]
MAVVLKNSPTKPGREATRLEKEADGPPPPELMEARFGGERVTGQREAAAPLAASIATATWQELGPLNLTDPGQSTMYEPSQGRINAVAGDAKNPQHLYAAGASGGVWVTTDGGTTWSPRAQTLPIITVSSIVVDQNDGNVVYIATGEADGRVTPSIGVYKSTDGGTSWNPTGLTFQTTEGMYIPKLAIDPTNGANVYAAATDGVYYTQNGGANWTKVQPSGSAQIYRDIKLQPGTPGTVFAVADNGAFFRSTNSGANWQPATGVPDPSAARRAVLGVTAANSNAVFLLAALVSGGTNDLALYKSNDGGGSFARIPSTTLASFASGQATFFDLVLAVSPTDPNELMAGVSPTIRSTDGGSTWFFTSSGPAGESNPIVHVDQHAMEYINNAIYDGSDGGLHRSTDGGVHWANLSPTLGVGQIYQVSGSRQNPSL